MRMLERSFRGPDPLRRWLRRVDRRPLGRLRAARLVLLRQRDRGRGARRPRRSIAAIGSGGTCTTGARRTRFRRSSARSRSRSCTDRRQAPADRARVRAGRRARPAPRPQRRCSAVGVPVASQLLGTGSGTDSLAVLVGTWQRDPLGARGRPDRARTAAQRRVRPVRRAGGASLQLLDPRGAVVRTLGAGAGLIAATARQRAPQPTWLITGTDPAGSPAAAAALTPRRLHDHFALAVQGGTRSAGAGAGPR